MSDAELQSLLRIAERDDSGAAWLAAGTAFARAGRPDDAGRAALRARAAGGDSSALLDTIAPALDELRFAPLRPVPGSFIPQGFFPDGRSIYGTKSDGFAVLDLVKGSMRTVATPPQGSPRMGKPSVFATVDALATRAAIVRFPHGGPTEILVFDLPKGELRERIATKAHEPHPIAFAGRRAALVMARASKIESFAVGQAKPAKKGWSLDVIGPSFDSSGAFAGFDGDNLVLGEALEAPRARVPLGLSTEEWKSSSVVACGGRAVVAAGRKVRLVAASGAVLGERQATPIPGKLAGASLSGWIVALDLGNGVMLLDLRTGAQRFFALRGYRRSVLFAPSGRRAVVWSGATWLLLEVPGELERTFDDEPIATGWIELAKKGETGKIRLRVEDDFVDEELPNGSFIRTEGGNQSGAQALFAKTLAAWKKKGWREGKARSRS